MVERQKFTLYQQEMLLGRQKSTIYQHAAREAKTHTSPAGYAGREGQNYTLLAQGCSRHKVIKLLRLQDKKTMLNSKYSMVEIQGVAKRLLDSVSLFVTHF